MICRFIILYFISYRKKDINIYYNKQGLIINQLICHFLDFTKIYNIYKTRNIIILKYKINTIYVYY